MGIRDKLLIILLARDIKSILLVFEDMMINGNLSILF